MTLRSLISYVLGSVRVKVKGKNPERLVNLCVCSGFPVWDIAIIDEQLYFSTTLKKYRQIRPLARKARCVPRIVKRVGMPFFIGRVKRRPVFVLVAAVLITTVLWLSGSVWVISVKGNVKVSRQDILRVVSENGLKIGARKNYICVDNLQRVLTIEFSNVSWVYVRFEGTRAVIEVVEKVRAEVPGPGDIVAAKDGVVDSVFVLSGVPLVKSGQTVKKGELLIAGVSSGNIKGARGSVTAKTWYEVSNEEPLSRLRPLRTGRKKEFKVLKAQNKEFVLFPWGAFFEWYEVEEYPITDFGENRLFSDIELIARVFYEVEWKREEISEQQAIALAKAKGERAIESWLPSSAKLIDFSYEAFGDEEYVVVRIVAGIVEEIGKTVSWPNNENGG